MKFDIEELYKQIKRFQKLADYVGCSKCSSFQVELFFDIHSDNIEITAGTYDIGDWPRTSHIKGSPENIVERFTEFVDAADKQCDEDMEDLIEEGDL